VAANELAKPVLVSRKAQKIFKMATDRNQAIGSPEKRRG
jgi:hypothetical protein